MNILVRQGLQQASLDQIILKAIKQKSFTLLLLFGLDVEIEHATGSKTLLTEISKLLSPARKLRDIKN